MTEHILDVGDIVIGKAEWNINCKGEVIRILEGTTPAAVIVRYENGRERGHFRCGSTQVRWIGRKIPVINISELI